jgi:two-component system sensor histidine kinase ChvG
LTALDPPIPPRGPEHRPQKLFWTRRASLTARILAVNIIALGLLAGSLFYLDSYRKQLLAERFKLARSEAQITAEALLITSSSRKERALLVQVGKEQKLRLRLYDPQGKLIADSFELAEPSFRLIDPAQEPWYQEAARILDRGMDALLGAPRIPDYHEPVETDAEAWPELHLARAEMRSHIMLRYAPDRTPVISAAVPVGKDGTMLLTTRNALDITQSIRDARQTLAIIVALALAVSIQLSLFLARTIVQPLRALVRAAVRVRLGRDREVEVPRLPERRDEIGLLARAISDMTGALRQRIDAVEHFAADVAHEIKNPLASLRSALDSLGRVNDPDLRRQLTAIALHDVKRIDRLVTEIADASRVDAELSRAIFEPVDLERLIAAAIGAREDRGENAGHAIRMERRGPGRAEVLGVPARLERVIDNLLDNAVSFSPPGGSIEVIVTTTTQGRIWVMVCDHGPGIPESERETIFERFHSVRPETEDFGQHSGLGLAIARTIAEAHDGTLSATDRLDGRPGACLVLDLPLRRIGA